MGYMDKAWWGLGAAAGVLPSGWGHGTSMPQAPPNSQEPGQAPHSTSFIKTSQSRSAVGIIRLISQKRKLQLREIEQHP